MKIDKELKKSLEEHNVTDENPDIPRIINYEKYGLEFTYNATEHSFDPDDKDVSNTQVIRYIKGIMRSRNRFIERVLNMMLDVRNQVRGPNADQFLIPKENADEMLEIFDSVEPFSYKEAFGLKSETFKRKVFSSVDVREMIENLGHEKISTKGNKVKHKVYSESGELMGEEEFHNIYEVHKVDGTKLGANIPLYAIRGWCTTTNKEFWLFLPDDTHKDDPLEAIASTFYIYRNQLPYIKEIKRNGDVLLCEMDEYVEPEGEPEPLTAEEYFGLLTCQS